MWMFTTSAPVSLPCTWASNAERDADRWSSGGVLDDAEPQRSLLESVVAPASGVGSHSAFGLGSWRCHCGNASRDFRAVRRDGFLCRPPPGARVAGGSTRSGLGVGHVVCRLRLAGRDAISTGMALACSQVVSTEDRLCTFQSCDPVGSAGRPIFSDLRRA
jgi:hypothetical protein